MASLPQRIGNGEHDFPAKFVIACVTLFYGKETLIVHASDCKGAKSRIMAMKRDIGLAWLDLPLLPPQK